MFSEQRVALITGGNSGIGRATAIELAKHGVYVALLDLRKPEAAAMEIERQGGQALALEGSVANRQDCLNAVANIKKHWGRVDILVNCAGVLVDKTIKNLTEEIWDQIHSVNLKGTLFTIQAVQPVMKEQNWGRIVNIASAAYVGNFGQSAYATSKAGVVTLTKVAALEMARSNVTVNCIAPGMVKTPMTEGLSADVLEAKCKSIPIGRIGETADIVHMILCFVSEGAGYITGQTIFVDGGSTMVKKPF